MTLKRISGGALAALFAVALTAPSIALAGGGGCSGKHAGQYNPKATSVDPQIDLKTLTDTSKPAGEDKKI